MYHYLLGFLSLFGTGQQQHATTESIQLAASYARYMVQNGLDGVFATNYHVNSTYAYASKEDFAESANQAGYPVFLLADISSTAKNLMANPHGSFAIGMTNCSENNYNGLPYDPLACPRLTLVGQFTQQPYNTSDPDMLAYITKHPAATAWIKSGVHQFNLWTFVLEKIYYIGGYGNLHYIGDIPLDTYFAAEPVCPS